MSAVWHYSRGGHRAGPVSADQLKKLADLGELKPDDLVWKIGMPAWQPAEFVKGLFDADGHHPAAVVASVAAVANHRRPASPVNHGHPPSHSPRTNHATHPPRADHDVSPLRHEPAVATEESPAENSAAATVGYFSPTSGSQLPFRVAHALKGFPQPRGAHGRWLDDHQLAELKSTEKWRKQIRLAAGVYRVLQAIFAVMAAGYVVLMAWMLVASPSDVMLFAALAALLVVAIFGGIAALLWWMCKAIRRCATWAPLTMFILFVIFASFYVVMMGFALVASRQFDTGMFTSGFVGAALNAIFAVISWKAYKAIPKFLDSPLWCVETLVHCGL